MNNNGQLDNSIIDKFSRDNRIHNISKMLQAESVDQTNLETRASVQTAKKTIEQTIMENRLELMINQ